VDPRELNLRVRLALRHEAERRRLQAATRSWPRIGQGSWIHSLAGGAEASSDSWRATRRHPARRQGAGAAARSRAAQMVAQPPGYGVTSGGRGEGAHPIEGDARRSGNFR
jgi:hypothetical protein